MKRIYKYPITLGLNEFEFPEGYQILSIQIQHDNPQMWVLLDPAQEPKVTRRYQTFPTGYPIKQALLGYIGTFQLDGGTFIFHLFEVK